LVMDQELGEAAYIPKDKTIMALDGFNIALQSSKSHPTYTERVINMTNTTSRQTRALVHLQMVGWPGPDLPLSPACLLDTAVTTLGLRRQQRVPSRPVLVHCMDGGSKSATFLAILWLVEEMDSTSGPQVPAGQSWPDVCTKLGHLMLQRKGVVRDKQFLRLVYESMLYYMQDSLMKQGILNTGNTSVLGGKKSHSRHPSQDFVGLTVTTLKEELKNEPKGEIPIDTGEEVHEKVADDAGDVNESISSAPSLPNLEEVSNVVESDDKATVPSVSANIPDDLTKLADISLPLEKKSKKISKDDFLNPSGKVGKVDPADPLSLLDPLWSLK